MVISSAARSCLSLEGYTLLQSHISDLPVGQEAHGWVDHQLYESLGGKQQPHADVFLGEELLALRAAAWQWWAAGGRLRRAAARRPVRQLRSSGGAQDSHCGVVKIGEHGGERRSLHGWRSRLSLGWGNRAVSAFVFCCVKEGGDDRYWKKRQGRD